MSIMKKLVFIVIPVVLFNLSLINVQEKASDLPFYYYQGERYFINQQTDRIFVKFAPDAGREQLQALIDRDASLQQTPDVSLDNGYMRFAVLEAKNGRNIPASTLEDFMAKPEVVSATHMFLSRSGKC